MKPILQICYSATQAEVDLGVFTARSGGVIVIVDANGQPTGPQYEVGAAGSLVQQIATTAIVASAVATVIIKDWQASTVMTLNEVRRATVAAGTVELGDLIRSNSTRTTGATFDAIEAGNWTEFAPDIVTSVAGRTGAVVLTKADTGLGNVDNTTDLLKPISTATQTALNAKAPVASPAFTGIPTVPTAAVDTNTTQAASAAFVHAQLSVTLPVMDGTATAGTGTRSARGNHVHPTDTSRAPIASPVFTGTVTLAADPTLALHAAPKQYVDNLLSGLSVKEPVRAATTVNINLTTDLINGDVIDGITLVTGNRVLVKNQTTGSQNGIYVAVASGAGTRATDFDGSPVGEVKSGAFAMVSEGTVNADSGWVLTTNGTITVGTTALAFVQFTGAGQITAGTGLTKTGNTLSITNDAITYALMQNVSATDKLLGRSTAGAGDVEEIPLTAFGRSILDDVDGAAVRETIQAASRNVVKEAVRVAITSVLPANTRTLNVLTASANGALAAQDGVTLVVGDRVLVAGEVTTANRGIYTMTTLGTAASAWSMTRAADFDGSVVGEVQSGMTVPVSEGNVNLDSLFMLTTNGTITVNTTGLAFTRLGSVGEVLIGATANPVTTTQGFVNTSTPVFTGKYLGTTTKIWRMDVRGWFPNATANVQNVNGVTQAFLRDIGTGELINTGGWVNRSGANQHHLIKDIPNSGGHISAFYLYNTHTVSHIVALYNTHSGADFNGMEFQGFCEFTDSNLV